MAETAERNLLARGMRVWHPQHQEMPVRPDLILTFGGDGTLLAGAGLAMQTGAPLFGFNLGTMGFLTEGDPSALAADLEAILTGNCGVEERNVLSVVNQRTQEHFQALNDAVITRGGYARLIRVESWIDDRFHDVFTADGMIVATPTGSTGYSLSAGGPIVDPAVRCMVITPVCPHSLQHCSTVVSEGSTIRLKLQQDRMQTAELQIDGQNKGMLGAGDEIRITGSEKKIGLLRLYKKDFYQLMRSKLSEWGSKHE